MEIPIDDILITEPMRPVCRAVVTRITRALDTIGPIVVTPCKKKYRLVDGLHRLTAMKEAGYKTVEVTVVG